MDVEEIKKLLSSPSPNVKKLEAVAARMPALIAESMDKHDVLLSGRRAKLLTASDPEIAELDGQAAALLLYIERLEVLAEEIDTRIFSLRHDTAVTTVASRRAEVIKLRDEAANKIQNDFPRLCSGILAVMGAVAKAQMAIDELNRFAAENDVEVDHVADPEEVARTRLALPPEIIEERVVARWVNAETGNRINGFDVDADDAAASAGKITKAYKHGIPVLEYRSNPNAIPAEVVKQKFRKVTTKARHAFPMPLSLAESIALPGIFGGDPAVWTPLHFAARPPSSTRSKSMQARSERRTEVQWIPISDAGCEIHFSSPSEAA